MKKKTYRVAGCLMALSCVVLLAGCNSPPRPARDVSHSGFLGDYSKLKPGESGDEVSLYYINPDTDFSVYKKLILEPITVWAGEDSSLDDIKEEEIQALIDYLDAAIREQISEDYKLVERAGSGVLRLRIALTDGEGANVALNTVSSVVPPAIALSVAKHALTGTPVGVSEISLEAEIKDSVTGERLAAVVDSRVGRKALPSASFTKWGDAKIVFDFLATQLRERLEELRTR